MKNILGILVILSTLVACEKSNETDLDVPESAINKSLEMFNGSIIERRSEIEDGIEAWAIKIENENRSVVKFYWSKNGLALIKIDGQEAPFDYDINPGENLINLSTAMTIAKSVVKNENVNRWKLKQEDEFIGKWIYSFEFEEISRNVFMDALNGDILEID